MFCTAFRANVNHKDDATTSTCEGYHSSMKGYLRSTTQEHLKVDSALGFLETKVAEMLIYRTDILLHGAPALTILTCKGVQLATQTVKS